MAAVTVEDDHPEPVAPAQHPLVVLDQRRHLRNILRGFLTVVVLIPFAGLGGAWAWLIAPLVVVATLSLREAMRLRRSVREHGHGDRRV